MFEYFVYILTNAGRTVLYTGVTNNLEKRLMEHKTASDIGAFTARYKVNRLVYFERHQSILHAIAREKEIKGWRREKKMRLIASANPNWDILNECHPEAIARDPAENGRKPDSSASRSE